MAVLHYNYYPPAGSVVDTSDGRVSWNGRQWVRNGRQYKMPSSHRLIGKAGGPLAGWTYDWKQRAWVEPSAPAQTIAVRSPPAAPAPACTQLSPIKTEVKILEKKSALESLISHPVASIVGGLLVVATYLTDEPVPPAIPAGLDPTTAQGWQMTYARNQQRFSRRMEMYQELGKVLLGYSSVQTILDALPSTGVAGNDYRMIAAARKAM